MMAISLLEQFNKNLKSTPFTPVNNQTPTYGVLTCSDSRVNLSHLVGKDIYDEVFLIENAGNKINKGNIGSIDYALNHTNVSRFIVLGHSTCGACGYAFATKTKKKEPLLDKELKKLKKLATKCSSVEELEIKNIQKQVKKLHKIFPTHKDKIIGMYYKLAEKKIELV